MADKEWAGRRYVNDKNQVEFVQLIEDYEKPDGILSILRFDGTKRLPDKEVPVRIQRTGYIFLEEATLEATNEVVDQWVRSNDFKLK